MTDEISTYDITALPCPKFSPRFSLVVIRGDDPAQLFRFYSAIGMSFEPERHGKGPIHYFSIDTGITFEIYPRRPEEPPTTGTRLGFDTVDLDVVLSALETCGGTIITPASMTPWGRRAVAMDPVGHKVELTEQKDVRDVSG
jgi:predicted enzyme related to lactoylglutathione lyase